MKLLLVVITVVVSASINAQCPNWLNSVSSAITLVKKAEQHFNVSFKKLPHQPNTDFIWRDTTGRTWVKISADDEGSVIKQMVIRGRKSAVEKLITDLYTQLPGDCILEKRDRYIKTKQFEIDIREEEFNPRITSEPMLTLTFSSVKM